MKTSIIIIAVLSCIFLSGCIESLGAGAALGAALVDTANKDLINAVTTLNAKTAEVNGAISVINGVVLARPESIEAYEMAKDIDWKDPVTITSAIGLISAAFFGGKVHEKRKA